MSEPGDERKWVVEPPEPGHVVIHIVAGDGVELTDEQQAAVLALVQSFEAEEAEVAGFAAECPYQEGSGTGCQAFCGGLHVRLTGGAPSVTGTILPSPRI